MSSACARRSGERTVTRVELDGRGFLTVLGGFLLLLPGFMTDVRGAAAASFHPALHGAALRRAAGRAERASGRPEVVDLPPGEWRRVPEERIGTSHPRTD